jgi:hypothetical protein
MNNSIIDFIKGVFSNKKETDIQKSIELANDEKELLSKSYESLVKNSEETLSKLQAAVEFLGDDGNEIIKSTVNEINSKIELVKSEYKEKSDAIYSRICEIEEEMEDMMKAQKENDLYPNYKDSMKKSLGMKREQMPQLKKGMFNKVINHFMKNGQVELVTMKLKDLKPSQGEINEEKLGRILNKKGKKVLKKSFVCSKDGYLADYHHNWAAGMELTKGGDVDVRVYRINKSATEMFKSLSSFKGMKETRVDINDKKISKSEIDELAVTIFEAYESKQLTKEEFSQAKTKIQELANGVDGYSVVSN